MLPYQSGPFIHPMAGPPHMAVAGYIYPPFPGPFPVAEAPPLKSGAEIPAQPFATPVHGVDPSRNLQPPQQGGNPNVYPSKFSNRRPNIQQPCGPLDHQRNHQRPSGPGENLPMPPVVAPRPFVRAPSFGPAPGFVVGPSFHSNNLNPHSF